MSSDVSLLFDAKIEGQMSRHMTKFAASTIFCNQTGVNSIRRLDCHRQKDGANPQELRLDLRACLYRVSFLKQSTTAAPTKGSLAGFRGLGHCRLFAHAVT